MRVVAAEVWLDAPFDDGGISHEALLVPAAEVLDPFPSYLGWLTLEPRSLRPGPADLIDCDLLRLLGFDDSCVDCVMSLAQSDPRPEDDELSLMLDILLMVPMLDIPLARLDVLPGSPL